MAEAAAMSDRARSAVAGRRTDMSVPPETQLTAEQTGCYVYGIVPVDVKVNSGVYGVDNREIRLVRCGAVAALISDVGLSGPLGTPENVKSHREILDSSITDLPVLPVRFGAVLAGEHAVVEELLEPHHDEFVAALEELDGRAEYLVKGRYIEQAILEEILSQDRRAAQLRRQIRGADAAGNLRIRLGELKSSSIAAKREEDTRLLLSAMEDHSKASFVPEPTHELDAVHVAFLLDVSKADELERVTGDLGSRWAGRVELRVLGPMAPYDFAGIAQGPQG
jgi:Gas vesicle synthesis protein GvpL/GvpF